MIAMSLTIEYSVSVGFIKMTNKFPVMHSVALRTRSRAENEFQTLGNTRKQVPLMLEKPLTFSFSAFNNVQ
jgi:hypothetical protein